MGLTNYLYDTIWVYTEIRKRTKIINYRVTLPPSQPQLCQLKKKKKKQTQPKSSDPKGVANCSRVFCLFFLFSFSHSVCWSHKKKKPQTNKNHTKNPPNKQIKKNSKKKCPSDLLAWNTAGCCPSARCQWLKAASLAENSKDVWLWGRNTSSSSGMKDLRFWVPLKLQRFAELSSLAQSLWVLRPSSCSDVCLNKFL